MATEVSLICPKIVNNMEDSLMGAAQKIADIGALRASLSPQNARILNLLYPERSNGTVSFEEISAGVIVPRVRLRWRQKATANSVKTTASCSADSDMAKIMENPVDLTQYAEDGFRLTQASANLICDEFDAIQAARAGKSSLQSTVRGNKAGTINGELADRIANILQTVDTNAATALVDGIGVNLLHEAADATPAAQPMKFFNYNDAQQGPLRFFKQEMANLAKKHKLTGKPIIVTDSFEVINWFELVCGASCCSDAGVDYSRLITQQYEIYYSEKITDLIGVDGQENVIVFWPETFITLAVDQWRNTRLAMGSNRKISNTEFGAIAVTEPSLRIADTSCLQEIGVPRMTFDLRIREIDCVGDVPTFSTDFLVSLLYENVTAPADGDGVTGIFHYKVDRDVNP